MPALGERFRAAREARGLTLSDVAEQIRIRSVYLAAIEDENWATIGAPVYTRGFLRTYARFLALDPEEVVAAFNASSGTGTSTPTAVAGELPRARERQLSPLIWLASLVAVLLVAFVFYNWLTLRQRVAVVGSAPSSIPAAAPTAPAPSLTPAAASPGAASATSAPASALPLTPTASSSPGAPLIALRFSATSWVRVMIDGDVRMEGTFAAGTDRQFPGKKAVLLIGNAGGVDVTVDGRDLGKLGKSGEVVQRSFTLQ
jgi:cytoskeleton protein RodZ